MLPRLLLLLCLYYVSKSLYSWTESLFTFLTFYLFLYYILSAPWLPVYVYLLLRTPARVSAGFSLIYSLCCIQKEGLVLFEPVSE